MPDIHSPRQYFLNVVLKEFENLSSTLRDGVIGERRDLTALGHAAEACLHLADYVASAPSLQSVIPGAPRSTRYIGDLCGRYPHFALTRDVANAIKHRRITDQRRKLDGLESIVERWALIRYVDDEGPYFDVRKVVIVMQNAGAQFLAEDLLQACIAEWVRELTRLGIISAEPIIQTLSKRVLRTDIPKRPQLEVRFPMGEHGAIEPIFLTYDVARDRFVPSTEKIGAVLIDMKIVRPPSRFSPDQEVQESTVTITVADREEHSH